ncbi:hypothetical protein COB57_01570 [Candidatus Peregrinibacteria bacterium]|nr:MAG: hypothetical protein COB57_01570 [Candidatus Peregrinibacteria bacterium]
MKEQFIHYIKNTQERLLKNLSPFKRSLYNNIDWEFPVIAIVGERGIGKTTMMLQRIKDTSQGVYFSCDNIQITAIGIFNVINELYEEHNEKVFYIDEIHKYKNWEQEIKNITDSFPDTQLILSGSSAINIIHSSYDLSRRVLLYKMHVLSLKEFLLFKYDISLPSLSLKEIIENHKEISYQNAMNIKTAHFKEYLNEYCYFFRTKVKEKESFYLLLENIIKKVIYEDVSKQYNLQTKNISALEKILFLLANIAPSEMTYNNIAKKVQLDTKTVDFYITILEEVGLVNVLKKYDTITNNLLKEKKIFLSNTNLMQMFRNQFSESKNTGLFREVFFISAIKRTNHFVSIHSKQDFIINIHEKKYIFEIGGKNKKIRNKAKNTFIVSDDIKISEGDKIPLWLFGCIE